MIITPVLMCCQITMLTSSGYFDPTANINDSVIKMLHSNGKLTRHSHDTADVNDYEKIAGVV